MISDCDFCHTAGGVLMTKRTRRIRVIMEKRTLVTFACNVDVPDGWINYSGTLQVEIPQNRIKNARDFCFGAAYALQNDQPAALRFGQPLRCARDGDVFVLVGEWLKFNARTGESRMRNLSVGSVPPDLVPRLTTLQRDCMQIQLLSADCPVPRGRPEIYFQILVAEDPA